MSSPTFHLATVDSHPGDAVVRSFEVGLQPAAVVEALLARPGTVARDMSAETSVSPLHGNDPVHLEVATDGVTLWTRPGLGQWWYPSVLHVRISPSAVGSRIVARWGAPRRNRQILRSMFILALCSVAISVVALSLPWTTSLVAAGLCFVVPGLVMWAMRPSNRRLLSALYEPLAAHVLGRTDTEGTGFRRRPQLAP